jgi:hypothetical protein
MIKTIKKNITSPLVSISGGYIYIIILCFILYGMGFYENSTFFTWGTPVTFMGKEITDDKTYYSVLFLFFIHQLINNWVNEVVYPWVINYVQNKQSKNLIYSESTSMLLMNMWALYSELDVMFIVSGFMSQLTFFIVIIIANVISTSIITWQYITDKRVKNVSFYDIVEEIP